MENLDYVTADWAKKVSENEIDLITKLQLKTCLTRIAEEAKKQNKNVTIWLKPSDSLIKELEKRGFYLDKFEIFNNKTNEDNKAYFKIFW